MNTDAAEIWSQIRATRADPPAPAKTTPERRRTYGTALEQAQQMFRAAEAVGPETQPLLIFYGLSQAGRAIAAASGSAIAKGDGWRLNGHGIKADNLDGPLADIQVSSTAQHKATSFVRLSEILGSPPLPKPAAVRLEEIWDCIPENQHQPLSDDQTRRRTPLFVSPSIHKDPQKAVFAHVVGFPSHVVSSPRRRQALDSYLQSFPLARDYAGFHKESAHEDADPEFTVDDGWGRLFMRWEMPSGKLSTAEERLAHLGTLTCTYLTGRWFFPETRGTGAPMHPLMAWWAVLYMLSMLARYQPDQWARHINVDLDGSRAVAIEQLLREALTTVPYLISETIQHVAEPAV